MQTLAVLLNGPRDLSVESLDLTAPSAGDLVVEIAHSGISTGTEKLFWSGQMPPFPGMGYPLVPGYEAAGEVVEAGADTGYRVGDHVFVPGASCYRDAFGLFGGAARRVVTAADRVTRIDAGLGAEGALLARDDLARVEGTLARHLSQCGIEYLAGFWEVLEHVRLADSELRGNNLLYLAPTAPTVVLHPYADKLISLPIAAPCPSQHILGPGDVVPDLTGQ